MNIPKHIAFIADGNRRWAKKNKLESIKGHHKGYEKIKTIPKYAFEKGVDIISIYAFSTENWNRSEYEVNYLMKLMRNVFTTDIDEINKQNIKLLISGRIEGLPEDLPQVCKDAIEKTKNNTGGILNICFNYGGRPEIVDAIKNIIQDKISTEKIDENLIRKYLYNGQLPDPDIIVRTGGEKRLSNFLMWESVYSELMFIDTFWPDVSEVDVDMVIDEYNKKERRFGGDSKK
jgi:undecaprenyl diphosphate synthase